MHVESISSFKSSSLMLYALCCLVLCGSLGSGYAAFFSVVELHSLYVDSIKNLLRWLKISIVSLRLNVKVVWCDSLV